MVDGRILNLSRVVSKHCFRRRSFDFYVAFHVYRPTEENAAIKENAHFMLLGEQRRTDTEESKENQPSHPLFFFEGFSPIFQVFQGGPKYKAQRTVMI